VPQRGHPAASAGRRFDSDSWITGNNILKAKAKENGWTTLETISNRDQNKQNDQVKAMVERKVDGIVFIPTDNNAAKIINQMVAGGAAILFISSEIEELIGIADRIMVMGRGEVRGFFERTNFDREAIMKAALWD
jgi:NADPH:quinone reductase-like Zn-dependent oxidoreductase